MVPLMAPAHPVRVELDGAASGWELHLVELDGAVSGRTFHLVELHVAASC